MSGISISQADSRVASFEKEENIKKFGGIELLDYRDDEEVYFWLDKEDYQKIKKIAENLGW